MVIVGAALWLAVASAPNTPAVSITGDAVHSAAAAFEENAGQASPEVRAIARVPGMRWRSRRRVAPPVAKRPARHDSQKRRTRKSSFSRRGRHQVSASDAAPGRESDAAVRFENRSRKGQLPDRAGSLEVGPQRRTVRSIRVIDDYDGIDDGSTAPTGCSSTTSS